MRQHQYGLRFLRTASAPKQICASQNHLRERFRQNKPLLMLVRVRETLWPILATTPSHADLTASASRNSIIRGLCQIGLNLKGSG